jgi:hypothetical protein
MVDGTVLPAQEKRSIAKIDEKNMVLMLIGLNNHRKENRLSQPFKNINLTGIILLS